MAQQWGLSQPGPKAAATPRAAKRSTGLTTGLPPAQAREAHRGIVWIHLSAMAVWLFVAVVLGTLMAAGKAVPLAVVLAGVGAAAGHGLFLLTHMYFAAAARKRAAGA